MNLADFFTKLLAKFEKVADTQSKNSAGQISFLTITGKLSTFQFDPMRIRGIPRLLNAFYGGIPIVFAMPPVDEIKNNQSSLRSLIIKLGRQLSTFLERSRLTIPRTQFVYEYHRLFLLGYVLGDIPDESYSKFVYLALSGAAADPESIITLILKDPLQIDSEIFKKAIEEAAIPQNFLERIEVLTKN